MRRFGILVRQQIWQLFISPSTYIAAFLFSAFMALMYLLALVDAGRVASENSPIANFLSVFWVPVLFMVPLLTMRSLSDELRRGGGGRRACPGIASANDRLSDFRLLRQYRDAGIHRCRRAVLFRLPVHGDHRHSDQFTL